MLDTGIHSFFHWIPVSATLMTPAENEPASSTRNNRVQALA
ncbi:hypothetical protein [Wolbachia endosymbiont of Ctenocephalides felis wCfeJ]|nr:hypothetical protein [Wolbachia endosymbiont of Ctenocephalides felis wCfeJ]